MAKTAVTVEEFELEDGTTISIKPLVISKLKRAMEYMNNADLDESSELAGVDYILSITKICLEGKIPDDYDLEDNIDIVTAKRVIAISTGVDFDDPKLMAMAAVSGGQIST